MSKERQSCHTQFSLPSIILECLVYQIRRSLAMKLVDLRARQIENVRGVACVPKRSRAIARVSLKCLQCYLFIINIITNIYTG